MHRLHPSAVLVALSWPRGVQMQTLSVVAVSFLDVAGQAVIRVKAQTGYRDYHSIEVGASAVIGARGCGRFSGLARDDYLRPKGLQFFVMAIALLARACRRA